MACFNQRGIIPEHYDYPQELTKFCGRKIKQMKLKNIWDEKLPVFIKSVEDNAAPGIVVNSWSDLEDSRLAGRAAAPRAGCLEGNIFLSARVCII